jgi:hypothetical protein
MAKGTFERSIKSERSEYEEERKVSLHSKENILLKERHWHCISGDFARKEKTD